MMRRLAAVGAVTALLGVGCGGAPPANAEELHDHCIRHTTDTRLELQQRIRAVLNDPDSMKTHSTGYLPADSLDDGKISVRLDYSAANMLGGRVRASAWAEIDLDCDIIRVTDYGF